MSESTAPFVIAPRMDDQLATKLRSLANTLDMAIEKPYFLTKPIGQTGALEEIGRLLWQASGLDAAKVLEAIEDARDNKQPVRIVITGAEYQHLPWELLYHDHAELGFIAAHSWCSVTRRVSGKGTKAPAAFARPIRVLLFISSPEDLDPEKSRLDFEREEELLFTALDGPLGKGEIIIDVAEDGSLDTLCSKLEGERYHAAILSMHGTPVEKKKAKPERDQPPEETRTEQAGDDEEPGLLFEDARTGESAPVAGKDLAVRLDRLPPGNRPGLLVLSACRSATAETTADAIRGVALELHSKGFERVLGMRLSVKDKAASVFTAELFRRMVRGDTVGRALALARAEIARGELSGSAKDSGLHKTDLDPFAQWTIPVLYDRTADGPLVNLSVEVKPRAHPPSRPDTLEGDRTIPVPSRGSFIGRRMVLREHLRPFLEGRTPRILFTGAGGVGKTELAGLFARHLLERNPGARILGFQAPFRLDSLYERLRVEAFDGAAPGEAATLTAAIQAEQDIRMRTLHILRSLARRERPCAFVLDNLESIQELESLGVSSDREESLWFVREVCALPHPTRVILTGRYSLPDLPEDRVARCRVHDAPYGDVLRRMNRLQWPAGVTVEEKRKTYDVLGGNHRAIEWLAHLLTGLGKRPEELDRVLDELMRKKKSAGTLPEDPTGAVVAAMQQNLLFTHLMALLSADEAHLLQAAALYRVPVNEDGLLAIDPAWERHEPSRNRLLDYALLDATRDFQVDLDYYHVPPVVKEFLREVGFGGDDLNALHRAMANHHRFQGAHFTRRLIDAIEAIHHFRLAGDHESADTLAEGVAGFYYRISNFADANRLAEEIAARSFPPPPWWALNLHGMCQLVLGYPDKALDAFNRALDVVTELEEKGVTFNNISQIHHDRGNYDSALKFLHQSLDIQKQIGDKLGEGTTLNNISQIHKARGNYESAIEFLLQSLDIIKQVSSKAGEVTILNNMAAIYHAKGEYSSALNFLQQSLNIQKLIGDKLGEGAILNNIGQIHMARGDHKSAINLLLQSLNIRRQIGDRLGESTTLNNISQIYHYIGNYNSALKLLKNTLDIKRQIEDKSGEGRTLNNIGQTYKAMGDNDSALYFLLQSLDIQKQIGDKAGQGATINNISQIYMAIGAYDSALNFLAQSLEILRQIGDKAGEATALNNISQIHRARGDRESALEFLHQSLEIKRQIGDKAGMIPTLHNMASIAWRKEESDQAFEYWGEALSLARETENAEGILNVAGTLGVVLAGAGDKENAKKLLRMAADAARTMRHPRLQKLEALIRSLDD